MADEEITPDLISEGLGAFDELERLGAGTFGTTFRAVRGDEEFALKVIHLAEMPDYLWSREITALRTVEHPNVVGFTDADTFEAAGNEYRFLRCEYIDGGSVADAIEAGERPPDVDKLREFMTGMLAGVGELHDLGIFHRDIKPDNVALRGSDWGRPVLLDFGLAKVVDMSSHTAWAKSSARPATCRRSSSVVSRRGRAAICLPLVLSSMRSERGATRSSARIRCRCNRFTSVCRAWSPTIPARSPLSAGPIPSLK